MRVRVIIPRIDLSWLFPLVDGPIDLQETSTNDFKHSLTSKLVNLSILKGEYKSRNRDEDRVVTLILMISWTWQLEEAGEEAIALVPWYTVEAGDIKAKLDMKVKLKEWISKNSLSRMSPLFEDHSWAATPFDLCLAREPVCLDFVSRR